MDQSKWSLPRLRSNVMTKSFQKLDRPRVKLQGVWAHGICLTLNVVEVRQASDATMVLEALAATLERVRRICESHGRKMPSKVILWDPCSCFDSYFMVDVSQNISVGYGLCSFLFWFIQFYGMVLAPRRTIVYVKIRTSRASSSWVGSWFRRAFNWVELNSTVWDTHIMDLVFWQNNSFRFSFNKLLLCCSV